MIVAEKMTINGRKFIHTYSDEGYMIDPAEFGRQYIETDEKIEVPEEGEEGDEV